MMVTVAMITCGHYVVMGGFVGGDDGFDDGGEL